MKNWTWAIGATLVTVAVRITLTPPPHTINMVQKLALKLEITGPVVVLVAAAAYDRGASRCAEIDEERSTALGSARV